MKKNRWIALSLLACSMAMLFGMLLGNKYYWFATDALVILVCAIDAVIILRMDRATT